MHVLLLFIFKLFHVGECISVCVYVCVCFFFMVLKNKTKGEEKTNFKEKLITFRSFFLLLSIQYSLVFAATATAAADS